MRTAHTANNPFAAFRDLDRVLNGVWTKVEEGVNNASKTCSAPAASARFAIDVVEVNDQLVVTADLPGFARDQVHVSVEDDVFTIDAKRDAVDHSESTVHIRERRLNDATRKFKVPSAYDTTQVDAKLEHGVLTLTLPKREEKKPHSIEVK